MTEQSPTVRKLRLGIELRRLRNRSGHTMLEAADQVARTDSTISRMETGQVSVSQRVLEKLLELYQASADERQALRVLAKEARRRNWWHAHADSMLPGFDVYLGMEAEATTQWLYEPAAVHGLLQTEEYARAMVRAEPSPPSEREAAGRVAVRMERQRRLRDGTGARLSFVLHEAVLHHQVGGPGTMSRQLTHLLAVSRERNVSVQVLPFTAGAHPAMQAGGFAVLSIPIGGDLTYDLAYLEHRTGGLCLDRPADVEDHKRAFEHLRARALGHDESRNLVRRVATTMAGDDRGTDDGGTRE
ncbi:helix-turn-helix domain-containing protein [Actinomadura scrupuli]|uniref:helix-turn-helix domain-containing protein n=1 Tax=Actinomadura scrupuli TaxID=559629 RepID=UPI003D95D613